MPKCVIKESKVPWRKIYIDANRININTSEGKLVKEKEIPLFNRSGKNSVKHPSNRTSKNTSLNPSRRPSPPGWKLENMQMFDDPSKNSHDMFQISQNMQIPRKHETITTETWELSIPNEFTGESDKISNILHSLNGRFEGVDTL